MLELVPPGTHIDFIGKWKACAVASLALIAIGLLAAPFRLHWGIDFAGGWEIQVHFGGEAPLDEGALREAVATLGVSGASVMHFGSEREYLVRFAAPEEMAEQSEGATRSASDSAATALPAVEAGTAEVAEPAPDPAAGTEQKAPDPAAGAAAAGAEPPVGAEESAIPPGPDPRDEPAAVESDPTAAPAADASGSALAADVQGQLADRILAALQENFGDVSLERVEFVGPRVGAELRAAGIKALLIAGVLILFYIAFRFSARFAPGAIIAILHDVVVTSSLWVLMGREFNLQVLAALLAIVGYSLNDTIIVYDRIRENMELRTTADLPEVLNRSVNQTLSRTVLTSGTTLAAVLSLLFLGGEVIRPFALAMAIGIVVGTYSSIYIAAPVLLWLERRYGQRSTAS